MIASHIEQHGGKYKIIIRADVIGHNSEVGEFVRFIMAVKESLLDDYKPIMHYDKVAYILIFDPVPCSGQEILELLDILDRLILAFNTQWKAGLLY